MNRYIALLRGINVSGHNAIRMTALQTSFTTLGLQEPQTYLQSGNVVFRAASTDTPVLAQTIAAQITQDFGHAVPVLVLSAAELEVIAQSNPLWPPEGGDEKLFHATFLFQPVAQARFNALKLPAATGERAVLVENTVLLHCPEGYGKTKLSNSTFEKLLGVPATTRNWRTVLALRAMCQP